MLNTLCQWVDKSMHAGALVPSPPTPPLGLWVACGSDVRGFVVGDERSGTDIQFVQTTSNRTWPASSSRAGSAVWLGKGTLHFLSSDSMEEALYG